MAGHSPLQRLRHHVSGAIERGEASPIVERRMPEASVLVRVKQARYMVDAGRVRDALSILDNLIDRLSTEGR